MSAGWTEIFLIALLAQLAVLPGEKVQFIIAGLSTRYDPWIVVAAAGTAFAGWTAVELLVGKALKGALPGVILDALTGGLFLLFAVLLIRSAPETAGTETDGGILDAGELTPSVGGYELPDYLGGFFPILAMMAAGEFGDKTQLVTIGLAVQYGAHPAIWFGEMAAIIPVSIANAFFFHRFSSRFDVRKAHLAGALLFAFFGFDTILSLVTGFSIWETAVTRLSAAILALG
ncbi:MAG: TMEM165/GDT1 family protein [Halodesulfurarchaeum sp.]